MPISFAAGNGKEGRPALTTPVSKSIAQGDQWEDNADAGQSIGADVGEMADEHAVNQVVEHTDKLGDQHWPGQAHDIFMNRALIKLPAQSLPFNWQCLRLCQQMVFFFCMILGL